MRRSFGLLAVGVTLQVVVGCGTVDEAGQDPTTPTTDSATSASDPATSRAEPEPSRTTSETPPAEPEPSRVLVRGIDASHHQGAIDWRAVAEDGISFAYLKASEGTTYVDPTFANHRDAALDLGVAVGGYHYFQLCSSGVEQATHFASVLGNIRPDGHLPPAVDLELAGSCGVPPAPDVLLAEVRAFLEQVESVTGLEPIVYLYPEFEARFGFADDLGDYRQWVRSLDGRPGRAWWMWQQTDSGSVDGIAGPVDINVARLPE